MEMMLLARTYPHPRDERIVFHEAEHYYEVDGRRYDASVSKVYHNFFNDFDAPGTVERCFPRWSSNKDDKYFQLINYLRLVERLDDNAVKERILHYWDTNRDDKAGYGTLTHRVIELYLNDEPIDNELPPEFDMFLAWRQTHPTWKPYRTEWSVFHEGYGIAGQIDSIWIDEVDGALHMVDWKVLPEMKETSVFKKDIGLYPYQEYPNTNLYHYYIQQNLYRYFLETKYDLQVKSCRLVQLHKTLDCAREWMIGDLQHKMETTLRIFRQKHPRIGYPPMDIPEEEKRQDEEVCEEQEPKKPRLEESSAPLKCTGSLGSKKPRVEESSVPLKCTGLLRYLR